MPRFVLLYHECPPGYARPSHWDFMLEAGDSLRTWALIELPRDWQAAHAQTDLVIADCAPISDSNTVLADSLGDHRRDYLDYEGPVGGERGRVTRIDAGLFQTVAESSQRWRIELFGQHLQGTVTLTPSAVATTEWMLTADRNTDFSR
jgi:hypothetical protein